MYKKNQDTLFIALLAIFSFFICLMRLDYSQHEDMGIFLSEFALIANGNPPYTGIFEIKDPLFLLAGGFVYKVFGLQGVYLQDLILVATSGAVSYIISRRLGLNQLLSSVASIIFVLTLCGTYYQALRSTLFALTLILLSFNAVLANRYLIAGFIYALIGGFKMPLLFILPSMLPLIVWSKKEAGLRLDNLEQVVKGFFFGLLIILLIMLVWSDVPAYFSMVQENFSYAKNYPEIVGLKPGFSGHLKNIKSYGSNFYLSLLCFLVLLIFARYKTRENLASFTSLAFMSLMTLILAGLMVMWPHHLHVMVFYIWPLVLISFIFYQNIFIGEMSSNNNPIANPFAIVVSVIAISYAIHTSGTSLPVKSLRTFENIIKPNWYIPPESKILEHFYSNTKMEKTFARLGPNDDMGLAAFLGKDWKLSCNRYCQAGFESEDVVKETLDCIKQKPNYLVVSQGFYDLNRSIGTFNEFRSSALSVIHEKFTCQRISSDSLNQVCFRK